MNCRATERSPFLLPFLLFMLAVPVDMSSAAVAEAEVRVGDSRDWVLDVLGAPRGRLEYEATEIMFYERGRVELRDGVVSEVRMVSAEAFERQRLAREEEEERQRVVREQRMAELYVEGLLARDRKLADAAFMNSTAAQRVAYWQEFKKRYPSVEIGEAYVMALSEREEALTIRVQEAAREQRISDLERRVASAEDRARRAEEEVVRSRGRGIYWGAGYGYGYPVASYNNYYPYKSRGVCKTIAPRHHYAPSSDLRIHRGGYRSASSCGVRSVGHSYSSGYAARSSGIGLSASYRGSSSMGRVGVRF